MLPFVDTIVNGVTKVLDKIVPDANVREQVKAELETLAFEWEKLAVADRESARRREVDLKDSTTRNLAWIYTVGYFGMLAALMGGFVNVPPAHDGLLDVLMGVLTAGQYSVLSYYFGSSHGSANKDKTIDRVVNHNG